MTIHGAKGLEWDVVIVPGLERKPPDDREKLLNWNEIDSGDADAAQIVLAPIAERGEAIEGVECLAEEHRQRRGRPRNGSGSFMSRARGRGRSCISLLRRRRTLVGRLSRSRKPAGDCVARGRRGTLSRPQPRCRIRRRCL